MRTYKRICIEDHTVTAVNGDTLTVRRGHEYITSPEAADGTVVVYSTFWVPMPVRVFAGTLPFTP